jgi:hypothetical protein
MKLKIKQGKHLVYSFYHSKRQGDKLLINLVDRWTYKGFKQKKNYLIIETENGDICFVFASEVVKLKFSHQEKDQVVFNCL